MSVSGIEVGGVMDDLRQGRTIPTHPLPLKLSSEHPLLTYRNEILWYRKQRNHRRPQAKEKKKTKICRLQFRPEQPAPTNPG